MLEFPGCQLLAIAWRYNKWGGPHIVFLNERYTVFNKQRTAVIKGQYHTLFRQIYLSVNIFPDFFPCREIITFLHQIFQLALEIFTGYAVGIHMGRRICFVIHLMIHEHCKASLPARLSLLSKNHSDYSGGRSRSAGRILYRVPDHIFARFVHVRNLNFYCSSNVFTVGVRGRITRIFIFCSKINPGCRIVSC